MTSSSVIRRLNAVARGIDARSYLEIGVQKGRTFKGVQVTHRTVVDPKFQVDPSELDGPGTRLEPTNSDDLFAMLGPDVSFDLVFIDGLHTFEQTYRDLCNVLVHTHRGSVIIIDDTRPSDIFSTLGSHGEAVEMRTRHGASGRAWHGDVFKVVFAIHDFHPSLAYVTIGGDTHPQTLVWRAPARPTRDTSRGPMIRGLIFDSMERISRLTYFDLLEHEEVLRQMDEAAAIGLCLSEVPR